MSTVTQFVDFVNRESMPDDMERHIRYTHLDINDEMKSVRRIYRRNINKADTGQIGLEI